MAQATVFSGRYELHRRLGRGGMAEVFLARDLQLDRPVAVKVLFPEFATDPAFVARFRREAQAAANLNHPNIVGVYDWGQEHGTYFIVMEYVDGRSLADLIREAGTIAPERAVDIATDVAAALAHAHKGGMLHRDIKPGNILVTASGLVKVADWGIGRAMDAAAEENLTQTGAVMGTATYFSPEQAQGLSLDARSDLYALGVVLYEMLTGRPPFQGDSPVAIAYKHVQEAPRPPRSVNMAVPPELEAIVLMLLEKDPARRYASADDLRADLRRYREGFKVMAMQPAAPTAMATTAAPVVESTQAIPVAHQTRAVVGVPVEDLPREYVPEREKRSWGFLVALVLLLGVLIVLLVLLAKTLGVGEDDGTDVPQIAVPDLSGQGITEDAARATLLAPNCTDTDPATGATTRVPCFVVGTTQFEEVDRPELVGTVIAQDPEGGTNVDQGTTVTLTVGAQNQIVIPEVAGSTPDEAAATLAQEGFTAPPQQREESSDEVEAGQVIGTDPPAGTEAPADAVITLIVSSGPPPIPIPDCAGRSVDECIGRLEQAGFTHTEQGESSDSVPEGTVLRLSPAEGTEAPVGTNVTIVVSSGPASVTVPPVVGLDRDAAIEALEDAGFDVDVQPQAVAPGDPDDGKVISQNPEGNDEAEPGSTVTIVVGQAVTDPGGGNGNGGGGGNG